mgnify:CR=1 FL=1
MAEAAALARAAPAATFPLLAAAMGAAQQQLLAAAGPGGPGAGSPAWAVALERLCWLVRMAAHCLADSGAGETPLMPLTLSIAVEAGGPALAAVEGLTAALLALPALALQEGAAAVLSPRCACAGGRRGGCLRKSMKEGVPWIPCSCIGHGRPWVAGVSDLADPVMPAAG